MGFAASQARLLMLTARKSDLELRLQFIQQARMQLANMMTGLMTPMTNTDPQSPEMQMNQVRIASIQQNDKMMEMQAQTINHQHEAVQTEIEAVQKVISKNIESSFKLMG